MSSLVVPANGDNNCQSECLKRGPGNVENEAPALGMEPTQGGVGLSTASALRQTAARGANAVSEDGTHEGRRPVTGGDITPAMNSPGCNMLQQARLDILRLLSHKAASCEIAHVAQGSTTQGAHEKRSGEQCSAVLVPPHSVRHKGSALAQPRAPIGLVGWGRPAPCCRYQNRGSVPPVTMEARRHPSVNRAQQGRHCGDLAVVVEL